MGNLTLADRSRHLTAAITDSLRAWEIPEALATDQDRVLRIGQTVEAVNGRISAAYGQEGFANHAEKILKYVREHHRFRSWPSIADFATAAEKCAERDPEVVVTVEALSEDERAARRIMAGQPVADTYVRGTGAARLIETGAITAADLRPYMLAGFARMKDVYGEADAQSMIDEQAGYTDFLIRNGATENRPEAAQTPAQGR